jgi:hypothetical protein
MVVGDHFVLLEDIQVGNRPDNMKFTAEDWQDINHSLDEVVAPLNEAYFGDPSDLDGNERVFVLFTAEVNRMTDPGASAFIAGFFNQADLLDAGQDFCPGSNEGEILYALAPDPDAMWGNVRSVSFAKSNARGIVAHEGQHLIHAAVRMIQNNTPVQDGGRLSLLDDTWSDEGRSHIAEEIAGLGEAGFGLRENLDRIDALGSQEAVDAFNDYHLDNFLRAYDYLEDPAGTLALGLPEDPGGLETLAMRGFAWLYHRWLADHYGPAGAGGTLPGSREEELFRELTEGGGSFATGTANVERAVLGVAGVSRTWAQLLSEYAAAVGLDDTGVSGLGPGTQVPTWHLPDLFEELNSQLPGSFPNRYPLVPTVVSLAATTQRSYSFDLGSSTAAYFTLRSGSVAPDAILEVKRPDGGDVTPAMKAQVTITRIR